MGLVRILELWLTGCFPHILNSPVLSNHPVSSQRKEWSLQQSLQNSRLQVSPLLQVSVSEEPRTSFPYCREKGEKMVF